VRTLHRIDVRERFQDDATLIAIEVQGTAFMKNMVRIIAGTLVEVGRGAIEPESMPAIIAAKERRAAGPTLPPNGLCLMWVRYPETGGTHAPEGSAPG